jgi:hypothetical protein
VETLVRDFLADVSRQRSTDEKATIRIRRDTQTALKEMGERFVKAWKTGKSDGDLLQFESPAALFRVLMRM